ncbi:MAG: hypothetical protein DCC71_24550 [Proteobacteria bacterium]|nr:MAG: hypothetical protein DCC71_24550 [Pseudomonadota bacterium]
MARRPGRLLCAVGRGSLRRARRRTDGQGSLQVPMPSRKLARPVRTVWADFFYVFFWADFGG